MVAQRLLEAVDAILKPAELMEQYAVLVLMDVCNGGRTIIIAADVQLQDRVKYVQRVSSVH